MHEERRKRLADFVHWATQHITGDEKGQAQIFLDRLFIAFGQKGSLDVGGSPELRIRKAKEDGGGTAFADYVWKPIVLIEMKKRGADLSRHYRQAFDYWTRLVPGRPKYVVLCNFDEFWVYDFDTQLDTPKDTLKLAEIPERYGPLAFLFPTNETPVFQNDREAVTRKAADFLAVCFRKLVTRKVPRDLAQRFILQSLMALFAEDIGLLDRYTFARLLEEIKQPADAYDLLGGLFVEMNTPGVCPGGRFKGVKFFNGGLFHDPARLPELYPDELNQLKGAAGENWSKVSPEIFGELFQKSMDSEERHAFGAHFTYPSDIMKIVKPTIVDPWTEAIESAKSPKKLLDLLERLTLLRVLDPACGSGNFLYLAYRDMKRLEARIRERLTDEFPETQPRLVHVNARQFFGLDINPFAIELAKVTMTIGRKLAIDELHIVDEPALPLDNLDANFAARDALIDELGNVAPWPAADVIIGNPPFLGSRFLAQEHGYEYTRKIHKAYPDVPKMADFCVYWFRRAHDAIAPGQRAGLVGTNKIRQGETREAGLDYIVANGGVITEAVSTQVWSGEANVHVSIANWIKGEAPGKKLLYTQVGDSRSADNWRIEEVEKINSALSFGMDVTGAAIIKANEEPKCCYVGQYPFNEGFLMEPSDAQIMIAKDQRLSEVIFPYMIGRDLVERFKPTRWIIDFGRRDLLEASSYTAAFDRVKRLVMPTVLKKAEEEKVATGKDSTRWTRVAERWWQFRDYQPGTMAAISRIPRYIACSRVTKRPIFAFVSASVHPDNALVVFPFADDYAFGVLQSEPHWQWFKARCSTLKSDFRYTSDTVFDTFPWPQSPTVKQIDAVAAAGREVRRVRGEALAKIKGGLRAVYRTLELPGRNPLKDAHAELDAAVLAAYGFDAKEDLLAQLLALNHAVAAKETAGQPVTPPGIPANYPNPAALVTEDCIRP